METENSFESCKQKLEQIMSIQEFVSEFTKIVYASLGLKEKKTLEELSIIILEKINDKNLQKEFIELSTNLNYILFTPKKENTEIIFATQKEKAIELLELICSKSETTTFEQVYATHQIMPDMSQDKPNDSIALFDYTNIINKTNIVKTSINNTREINPSSSNSTSSIIAFKNLISQSNNEDEFDITLTKKLFQDTITQHIALAQYYILQKNLGLATKILKTTSVDEKMVLNILINNSLTLKKNKTKKLTLYILCCLYLIQNKSINIATKTLENIFGKKFTFSLIFVIYDPDLNTLFLQKTKTDFLNEIKKTISNLKKDVKSNKDILKTILNTKNISKSQSEDYNLFKTKLYESLIKLNDEKFNIKLPITAKLTEQIILKYKSAKL